MERIALSLIQEIISRKRRGQSEREISRDLGHSRTTVRQYCRHAKELGFLDMDKPLAQESAILASFGQSVVRERVHSLVMPYAEQVNEWLQAGLEGVAIHQRLVRDYDFQGSYSSVLRFINRQIIKNPETFVRIETLPGQQAQVDFGSVGRMYNPDTGKDHNAYVFVMTLSFSRHQYIEFVFEQDMSAWIGCHRRAFESFGGTPREIVVDNLKAAVIKHEMEDPVLNKAYTQMARHYGFLIHPCRPRTPEHKGKVENGVHYVQRNLIASYDKMSLQEANRKAKEWVAEVAGMRKHGTTHEQPLVRFAEKEAEKLLPLPDRSFELQRVCRAKLHRDCHVVVEGCYYSAPFSLVGNELEVLLFEHTVQLYHKTTLLATHVRATTKGERITRYEHFPSNKRIYLERTPDFCREQAANAGPYCGQLVDMIFSNGPADQLRAVQSLIGLIAKYTADRVENACKRAIHYQDPHYKRVKKILSEGLEMESVDDTASLLKHEPHKSYAFERHPGEFFTLEVRS